MAFALKRERERELALCGSTGRLWASALSASIHLRGSPFPARALGGRWRVQALRVLGPQAQRRSAEVLSRNDGLGTSLLKEISQRHSSTPLLCPAPQRLEEGSGGSSAQTRAWGRPGGG